MNKSFRQGLVITVFLILILCGIAAIQSFLLFDSKLHIVFCDVGQGDGIFIRTPKGLDILIDGGPDDSILSCISSHMPFWDHTIDLVVLTHPHNDHFVGLTYVFDRYNVASFVTENITNDTDSFKAFLAKVEGEGIKTQHVFGGNRVKTADGVLLEILGPSKAFLQASSPDGEIDEGHGFGNVITHVSYGVFDALFTGDSQIEGLTESLKNVKSSIEIFQVPHHGSKSGFDTYILERVRPSVAVISVGAKNKYGHPTRVILDLLQKEKIPIFRTDEKGDIEVVSDGNTFSLK